MAFNPVLANIGTTIFTTMTQLSLDHQALNLGQGFPEEGWPTEMLDRAAKALMHGDNQYPAMRGVAELRQAVAAHDRRFYGLDYDWQSDVVVTCGATEGLAAAILGLLSPGDEVVLFEPLYDSYLPMIRLVGAIPRLVRLHPPDWGIDFDALRAAFNPRTRMILFNTPMNPTGKVFSRAELSRIGELCQEFNVIALCDEVYEHLVFAGSEHIPLASLPGMRDLAVRVGSAGKSFSLTGWKIGYLSGAAEMMGQIARAHQFLTFTIPPHLQSAVAWGLQQPPEWFAAMTANLAAKRERFVGGLARRGIAVLPFQGGYFATIDLQQFGIKETDENFIYRMTTEKRLNAIPFSAFYAPPAMVEPGAFVPPPNHLVRFCFAKKDFSLDQGVEKLAGFLGR
ncbi:MAG: aminotransferase [Candidatus Symbiobacter sp.]|nr:aminotransferase [Candidatus Symbiobacter sp.]